MAIKFKDLRLFDQKLIEACFSLRVKFHWTGILMIQREGIESVVRELPATAMLVGFESFTLSGYWTAPRSDNRHSYDPPIPLTDALLDLASLDSDLDLWVELAGIIPPDEWGQA